MSQYKLQKNWELDQSNVIKGWRITSYFCDLMNWEEKIYYSGAYKVVITDVIGSQPNETKIWKGETAWRDAERYFEDICLKLHREN